MLKNNTYSFLVELKARGLTEEEIINELFTELERMTNSRNALLDKSIDISIMIADWCLMDEEDAMESFLRKRDEWRGDKGQI